MFARLFFTTLSQQPTSVLPYTVWAQVDTVWLMFGTDAKTCAMNAEGADDLSRRLALTTVFRNTHVIVGDTRMFHIYLHLTVADTNI